MAEWLFQGGIGEARAARVEDGAIIEARIQRDGRGLRHGDTVAARVGAPATGGRTRVTVDGEVALLRGPAGVPEGAVIRVVVVREMIPETGNPKPAEVRLARSDEAIGPASSLHDRLAAAAAPVRVVKSHEADRLEEAGWGEVMEAARTGQLSFAGGLLRITLTPAMTVIDIDGGLSAAGLAVAGARAAARAIRLFDIGGSIGIDLPSAFDRGVRQRAAAEIDAMLPQPFERTAVNGFGFVQIVRPRLRASVLELVQSDPSLTAALALLKTAERARMPGGATLVAAPAVVAQIERNPAWLTLLAQRIGGSVALRTGPRLAISAGYVEARHRS